MATRLKLLGRELLKYHWNYQTNTSEDAIYMRLYKCLNFTLTYQTFVKVTERGKKFVFTDHDCKIVDEKGKIIATATKFRNLYYLNFEEKQEPAHVSNNDTREEIWHR